MKAKMLITFILSSLLICCVAQDEIEISVINNTMDNIEIDRVGGHHVAPGQEYHVLTLYPDLPFGSFKVCRGYGCLADVTVTVEFPKRDEDEDAIRRYDKFKLTENPRNDFDSDITGASYIKSVSVLALVF